MKEGWDWSPGAKAAGLKQAERIHVVRQLIKKPRLRGGAMRSIAIQPEPFRVWWGDPSPLAHLTPSPPLHNKERGNRWRGI
jgi:hypothetical protein